MFKGVNLTLLIGPGLPQAVSPDVIDALESVQVVSKATGTSGFELVFNISGQSSLQTLFLLDGGLPLPIVRVIIAVTLGGQTSILMDGVVTDHSYAPGAKNGATNLTVKGEDLTRAMDWIDFSGIPFPAMPPEAQVALCVVKYALLGVVPMIIPSVLINVTIPTIQILRQQGTDLEHVRRLAELVGYVFYLVPGPTIGSSFAYWGPQIMWGAVQPALSVDTDGSSNVEGLTFSYNADQAAMPIVILQEPITKAPIPIPVPGVNPLNPPLGMAVPIPKHYPIITGAAKLSPVQAALIGLTKAAKSAEVLTASGSLDVMRYGQVLSARNLVGVRGSGTAFDGNWYVTGVTHSLKRGEYKEQFTLSRNALVSTVGSVAV